MTPSFSERLARDVEQLGTIKFFVHFLTLLAVLADSIHLISLHEATVSLFLLLVISILLTVRIRILHHHHRRLKASILIADSLGADVRILLPDLGDPKEPLVVDKYYASKLDPGLKRYKINLCETLFFAHHLYRRQAIRTATWMLLPALLVILVAFSAPLLSRDFVEVSDRLILLIFLLLNEVHVVAETVELYLASRESEALLHGLVEAQGTARTANPFDNQEFALNAYATAAYQMLAAITPYPSSSIYRAERDALNRKWDEYAALHRLT